MQTISKNTSSLGPDSLTKQPFVVFQNVSKTYYTARGPYTVLKDVNLVINQGEFICVIGHSGCGKSTLLNMVSGFNTPTDGTVTVGGKPIVKPGPDR
ncbi:MAG: ATP-binding cassette domain-containing protein, partial [Microcoleaceae cyanobacterium]